jgi:membrane protease YdiL (CAAX protease family)
LNYSKEKKAMDTTVTRSSQVKDASISPMPFWQALLYFGLPALMFRFFLYTGIPAFVRLGLTPFEAYIVGLTVPAAILFAFAFGFYARDGYALTWGDLSARFRLLPLTRKDWLWSVVAFVVTFLSLGALAPTAQILISAFPALAVPDFFAPWARPGGTFDMASLTQFVGASVKGNWGFALLCFVQLFFNIFGEELWWRGYILPRQELTHGRWAWVINGLLWWLWHLTFYPWQVIALLPICLIIPFVAQRLRHNWTAIIIHWQNGISLVLILALVLGMV